MDDILLCVVFIAYFQCPSMHSFIFVTALIIMLFICWKGLKKQKKVHRRPAPELSSDTLHDILAFFDRKSLICLRSVDFRFNQTVQRGFASKPCLVLKEFCDWGMPKGCIYTPGGRIKFANDKYCDAEMIDQILTANFVRFIHAEITCIDRARLRQLMTISHRWQECDLRLSETFKLTKYCANRLAKRKKFDSIAFHGKVTFLPELFVGNCRRIDVTDYQFKTADSASVPWTAILEFLLRPDRTHYRYCGTYVRPRLVSIRTNDPPNRADYLQFVDLVKQGFANASDFLHFEFQWNANGSPLSFAEALPFPKRSMRHFAAHTSLGRGKRASAALRAPPSAVRVGLFLSCRRAVKGARFARALLVSARVKSDAGFGFSGVDLLYMDKILGPFFASQEKYQK
ncbi:hypothetical protein DdX_15492 [Ditylenchus destructor]|uniref:Uncharacterized protein n=1 Tax=Ditylenchus destructor TaxID=166010 RepID=A0AAD4MSM6_9BILA|nr:hypothetical protein DdX_15492 [Ditylenchus destructor]